MVGEEDGGHDIEASDSLWKAVRTIAIADAVMSLDNVVAIAAARAAIPELFIFGLLLSIPLIMVGRDPDHLADHPVPGLRLGRRRASSATSRPR